MPGDIQCIYFIRIVGIFRQVVLDTIVARVKGVTCDRGSNIWLSIYPLTVSLIRLGHNVSRIQPKGYAYFSDNDPGVIGDKGSTKIP